MATKKKMLQAAAGQAGGAALDITDVFSTYLYTGTGGNADIVNNIDLAGEGGLVVTKRRNVAYNWGWFDTERGAARALHSNDTDAEDYLYDGGALNGVRAFNSDGFSIGDQAIANSYTTTDTIASWTFRKAPKFFDVVTYTGDGANRTIAHNLGSVPGCIIVKRTDGSNPWAVYHRGSSPTVPEDKELQLNATDGAVNGFTTWNRTLPTDTVFSVGTEGKVNESGWQYVAYLFAHNDGDGEFGPDGDQDIIKCGTFTGGGDVAVNVGFEPQFVLAKNSTGTGDWFIHDTMRGFSVIPTGQATLEPNTTDAEGTNVDSALTTNGFRTVNSTSGATYIYMAIRRGPLAPPESGTEVFDVQFNGGNDPSKAPVYQSGFVTDMAIVGYRTGGSVNYPYTGNRLMGIQTLETHNTDAEESGGSSFQWDFMNGFIDSVPSVITDTQIAWMWKRAPGYFDAVAYTGNGTAGRTVSHNLTVAPEMMWVKNRSSSSNWQVYHKNLNGGTNPANYWLKLNDTDAEAALSNKWNDTEPTQSVFSVGNSSTCNASGDDYIAYLFASLPGISKVGSFSHTTGSTTDVDCGFSSGARFVLFKRTSATGVWFMFDTERGIVSGNDPYLRLDDTSAEINLYDLIDPLSSGFTVGTPVGTGDYIFYAIA